MSCGKCVLGSYFFLSHKSITTIKVSWAGQDLACTPETVEGSLFIETVLPLHWRSAMQYMQSVCLVENQITVNYSFHFNCITMEQTSVSDTFFSMLAPYACYQLDPPWLNLRDTL